MMYELKALTVSEIVKAKGLAVISEGGLAVISGGGIDTPPRVSLSGQDWRRFSEHNCACIVLGKPEYTRFRRGIQRIDRETATPTAVEFGQSAGANRRRFQ